MAARKLLVPLLIVLGLLAVPACTEAASYRLPVRTATLAVSLDYYIGGFVNGQPAWPYDLSIDPPVLRFGYDPSSGLVYETAVFFDWDQLVSIPQGTVASAALYLAPVSVPPGAPSVSFIQGIEVGRPVPEVSDFDWYSKLPGDVVVLQTFDPAASPLNIYSARSPLPQGYSGWILSTLANVPLVVELAGFNNGLGLDAPYVLVTTAPEPSSLVGLGTALLSLGGLVGTANGKRAVWTAALAVLVMAAVNWAGDDSASCADGGLT